MNMYEIDQAYKKWDKERTEEAKKLWYKAVKKWSEIHRVEEPSLKELIDMGL